MNLGGGIRQLPSRRRGANPNTLIGGVVNTGLNSIGCPRLNPTQEIDDVTDLTVDRRRREQLLSLAQEKEAELPELIITDTLITLFGPEELKRVAVVQVDKPEASGVNSVNDPRMGPTDENTLCATCHKDVHECPGHLGYIRLNVPIYHPFFLRTILRVLNSVCTCCSCPYLTRKELQERDVLEYTGVERLKLIEDLSKNIQCRRPEQEGVSKCNMKPIFIPSKSKEMGKVMYTYDKKNKTQLHEMSIDHVEKILRGISDEDAQTLMFENEVRPEFMIMRNFPVIPPNTRPIIYRDGVTWPDDLTNMYIDILKHNKAIPLQTLEAEREKKIRAMVFAIQHFIDNTDGKYSQGGRKDMLSIKQRIGSKKGVIRGFIMGKRVNYSGRTPISPDPSLRFGQIRIPAVWAYLLTVPVVIRSYNIKAFQDIIDISLSKGLPIPISYYTPGSGKLKGRKLQVTSELFKAQRLRDGDKIDRWLQDGDYIVGNRNPTLHKQGFMGFEVVLGAPLTIGLHISYTTPMNADFKINTPLKSTGGRPQGYENTLRGKRWKSHRVVK